LIPVKYYFGRHARKPRLSAPRVYPTSSTQNPIEAAV
jgi:hypothetical protein